MVHEFWVPFVLLNMFHKCVLITQKSNSLYTKFSWVTTHYHTLKKRMDYHIMWEKLGRLSKPRGLLQPRELSNNYMWVTSYTPISNGFNQAYNNTVWLVRCLCSRVFSSGSSNWWQPQPSRGTACIHYLLKSWPSEVDNSMQSVKSKTVWKLSFAIPHW